RYQSTGQVAMTDSSDVPGVTDSVWQSFDGGGRVRHCYVVDGGQHVCREVVEVDLFWGKSVDFIDPVNLGRFLIENTTAASNGRQTVVVRGVGGSYRSPNNRTTNSNRSRKLPATAHHGVWAAVAGGEKLYHCQLENDEPRCRLLPIEGEGVTPFVGPRPAAILGVFTKKKYDVLWIARDQDIFRCTAGRERPTPKCKRARMSSSPEEREERFALDPEPRGSRGRRERNPTL
ncbi:MAG: hypothetical protein AAGA56_15625, partial [Myxococcota bacterium]